MRTLRSRRKRPGENPEERNPNQTKQFLQRELQSVRSQLTLYAKDLKVLLHREEQKSRQLGQMNQQLLTYARDVKKAYHAERQKNQELEGAYADTLLRLALASRYKDEETGGHIARLSYSAKALALFIGWNKTRAQRLFAAAPMHDVGKIGIPDSVLGKHGPLDETEWKIIRRHPTIGASLLAGTSSPLLRMAREVALTHHERWDGSGYPQGLEGENIPMSGRIIMLVDQYDALRSRRPYKTPFTHAKACDVILNGSDRTKPSHFDPQLLEAFREIHFKFDEIFSRISDEA